MLITIQNIIEDYSELEYNQDNVNRLYKKITEFLEDNNVFTSFSKSDIKDYNSKLIVDFNFNLN